MDWNAAQRVAESIAETWNTETGPGGAVLLFDADGIRAEACGGLASLETSAAFTADTAVRYASISKHFLCALLVQTGGHRPRQPARRPPATESGAGRNPGRAGARHDRGHRRRHGDVMAARRAADGFESGAMPCCVSSAVSRPRISRRAVRYPTRIAAIGWCRRRSMPRAPNTARCCTSGCWRLWASASACLMTRRSRFPPWRAAIGAGRSVGNMDAMVCIIRHQAVSPAARAISPSWLRALVAGRGPLAGVLPRLAAPRRLLDGTVTGYGLGLATSPVPGLQAIGHGGSLPGFKNHFLLAPEQGAGVIVVSNREDTDAHGIALRVMAGARRHDADGPSARCLAGGTVRGRRRAGMDRPQGRRGHLVGRQRHALSRAGRRGPGKVGAYAGAAALRGRWLGWRNRPCGPPFPPGGAWPEGRSRLGRSVGGAGDERGDSPSA